METRIEYGVRSTQMLHGKWIVTVFSIPGQEASRDAHEQLVEHRRSAQEASGAMPDADLVCRTVTVGDWETDFDALIEQSSLGSPAAKELRRIGQEHIQDRPRLHEYLEDHLIPGDREAAGDD